MLTISIVAPFQRAQVLRGVDVQNREAFTGLQAEVKPEPLPILPPTRHSKFSKQVTTGITNSSSTNSASQPEPISRKFGTFDSRDPSGSFNRSNSKQHHNSPNRPNYAPSPTSLNNTDTHRRCQACRNFHATGYCPLKIAGHENCGLCGLAHFGGLQTCPHLQSETQVRLMLDALRTSTEPSDMRENARRVLRGIIGDLVLRKNAAQGKATPKGTLHRPKIGGDIEMNTIQIRQMPQARMTDEQQLLQRKVHMQKQRDRIDKASQLFWKGHYTPPEKPEDPSA
jgi:hypothetical protein